MREILFRGKAIGREESRFYRTDYKNGDWVYGFLVDPENYCGFAEMTNTNGISGIDVDRNTVGQYTGLTDKNGKKIFEGDIIKHFNHSDNPEKHAVYKVEFNEETCMFVGRLHKNWAAQLRTYLEKNYEVIGNIHDNPELLKEGAKNDIER